MNAWLPARFHRTPRSVWFAFGAGVVGYILVLTVVLFPVMGLVTSTVGAAGPLVHVPWLRIAVVLVAGNLLAWGLLTAAVSSRHGAVAWVSAIAAVVAALIVSVYPAVAAAFAVAGDAEDVLPTVLEWITRFRDLTGW